MAWIQRALCLAVAVAAVIGSPLPSPGLLGSLGGHSGGGGPSGHGGHATSYVSFDGHGGSSGGGIHLASAPAPAPVYVPAGHDYEHHAPETAYPKYAFKYGVHDAHTGDVKDQSEHRDGDVVKGEYSLLQPDGTTRTVHYTADKHGGFNAVVSITGHAIHPETKIVHAAPAVVHAAPSVVHAAPAVVHAAPAYVPMIVKLLEPAPVAHSGGGGGYGAATSYASGGLIAHAVSGHGHY